MSHGFKMNPDLPLPSIEHGEQIDTNATKSFASFRDRTGSPLGSSSPNRTPFKTPLSHPATPAPLKSSRSPSLGRNESRSSPTLEVKRSSSSLSVSRAQTPRVQLRRVSSNLNSASPMVSLAESEITPKQPWTVESVAKEYFSRELEAHSEGQSRTVVIVHDSCYGHRFSRPRTSKAALSTIVERPERIHATLLGASTAYVRLGERHADGANGPHPSKDIKTVPNPPFLIKKTKRSVALDHPAVTQVHGTKWMEELQIMCDSAESKLAMNGKELQRPIGYGKDENGNNLPKLHEGDLYLCSESLNALQGCLGGICDAIDTVFTSATTRRAFVCIRPPGHHCSSNYPSGFCWLNNVHIGISYSAMNYGLTHAAIIDFDLHHGDGSQTIAWDHNRRAQTLPKNAAQHKKTPIGYYSLHDINSYPCEWGDEDKVRNASLCIENAHGQSIWNVHLEPWTSMDHFWQLYEEKYTILLEKTRAFLEHHSNRLRSIGVQPKAAIFLSAGFDASQWEGQGMQRHNVNVPTEFYARLTSDVVRLASRTETGVDGRVISVLEGGYSDRALASGVLSHLCGLSGGVDIHAPTNLDSAEHMVDQLHLEHINCEIETTSKLSYDPTWWHETNLEALEQRVAGNLPPPPPPKKEKVSGNYSSPTHASTARMTDVARERKSLSTQIEARYLAETFEPGPPPPVDWLTASYELSRILIPNDRQTLSCRHDELNAEATKVRRERQSVIGVLDTAEPRMQLRTRGKGPTAEPEALRASSRSSNRRTTIAAVSELPDPSMAAQRPRRRSSAASSILSSFQDMKLEDGGTANGGQLAATRPSPPLFDVDREMVSKKTRMAAPAKKTSRVSSPRKAKESAQPISKVSSFQDKMLNGHGRVAISGPRPASRSRPGSKDGQSQDHSMDELTNGIKKVSIKLNMPTPEQHAENQRKAEESKSRKPRVVRKTAVPRTSKNKAPPPTAAISKTPEPEPGSEARSVSAAAELGERLGGIHAAGVDSTRAGDDQTVTNVAHAPAPPPHPTASAAVSKDSVDPASGGDVLQTRNDAHAGSSSYPAKSNESRGTLPVFTSSSPIPFAGQQPPPRTLAGLGDAVASSKSTDTTRS